MPFNRSGKFLSNLVNGGNNSGELGEKVRPSSALAGIGAGVIGLAALRFASLALFE
jgi:hypothetical protein